MKRTEMIKKQDYFNFIIKNGKFVKDKNFVIYSVDNENSSCTHFGIAIKNSIGNAVVRNKLKRQTRAIIDNNRKLFQFSKDYIIMIRNECLYSSFEDMNNSLVQLMKGN